MQIVTHAVCFALQAESQAKAEEKMQRKMELRKLADEEMQTLAGNSTKKVGLSLRSWKTGGIRCTHGTWCSICCCMCCFVLLRISPLQS